MQTNRLLTDRKMQYYMRSRSDILTFQQQNIDLYRCYQTRLHSHENNSWSYFNPYLLPLPFCTQCLFNHYHNRMYCSTLMHNNNMTTLSTV
jgi:hypothetical protein